MSTQLFIIHELSEAAGVSPMGDIATEREARRITQAAAEVREVVNAGLSGPTLRCLR